MGFLVISSLHIEFWNPQNINKHSWHDGSLIGDFSLYAHLEEITKTYICYDYKVEKVRGNFTSAETLLDVVI